MAILSRFWTVVIILTILVLMVVAASKILVLADQIPVEELPSTFGLDWNKQYERNTLHAIKSKHIDLFVYPEEHPPIPLEPYDMFNITLDQNDRIVQFIASAHVNESYCSGLVKYYRSAWTRRYGKQNVDIADNGVRVVVNNYYSLISACFFDTEQTDKIKYISAYSITLMK